MLLHDSQEILKEVTRLQENSAHVFGFSKEEDAEEWSQLFKTAEQNVARRQEDDLLDMLREWRNAKLNGRTND